MEKRKRDLGFYRVTFQIHVQLSPSLTRRRKFSPARTSVKTLALLISPSHSHISLVTLPVPHSDDTNSTRRKTLVLLRRDSRSGRLHSSLQSFPFQIDCSSPTPV